jgi:hypothetical protein
MGELLLGCSGWNYPDNPDKGGWTLENIQRPKSEEKEIDNTKGLLL